LARSALPKTNRRNLVLAVLVASAGVLLVAAIAVLASGRGGEAAGVGGDGPYRGSEPPARITLPDFDLPSYRGGRVSAGSCAGGSCC